MSFRRAKRLGPRQAITSAGIALVLACQVFGAASASAAMDRNWHHGFYSLDWSHSISRGAGVTIAVIDTQLNIALPSFTGQDVTAVGNFCPAGPDGTVSNAVSTEPHAAHATAIVRALAGNGTGGSLFSSGIRGIAPDAAIRLYAVSDDVVDSKEYCVNSGDTPGGDNSRTATASAAAIRQAIADGADIINLSQQTDRFGEVEDAVNEAVAAGLLVVVGSGNDGTGTVNPLATIPGVLAVAALSPDDSVTGVKPWPKSGTDDTHVLTSAIGDELMTGWVDSSGVWDDSYGVSGTSFAAPMVAGFLALAKAQYPEANRAQLVENLVHTTTQRPLRYLASTGLGPVDTVEMLRNNPMMYPPAPDRITTMTPAHMASAEAEADYQALVTAWGKTYEPLPAPQNRSLGGGESFLGISLPDLALGSVIVAAVLGTLAWGYSSVRSAQARSRQREVANAYGPPEFSLMTPASTPEVDPPRQPAPEALPRWQSRA